MNIQVIDSHTGGEPTRVVIAGGPPLAGTTQAQRLQSFRTQFDNWRRAIVCEPRGSDVLVGALLTPPVDPDSATGVLFFNTEGYLGMCGHGSIGVVTTLAHLGRLQPGDHWLETPVGRVRATLHPDGDVSIRNVPAYRYASRVPVPLPNGEILTGDIAWGGNWFFLVEAHGQPLTLDRTQELTDFCWQVRLALQAEGITGEAGALIDHVELFGPPQHPGAHSRSFVLCPGRVYDRSPCGTGTSAKLACLYTDGNLSPGEAWVQESITGSQFTGSIAVEEGAIIPTIRGRAFVNAESTLLLNPADPCCWGLPA